MEHAPLATPALPGSLDALTPVHLDALREVANIGAGHAATALSQMTDDTIMISVPTVTIARLEALPQLAAPDEPVAGVLMDMLGDLSGRTLLVLPVRTAARVAALMLRRPPGSAAALGTLERSAVTEAGNILSGAYMNALSEFMGMILLPSPPTLAIDRVDAVMSSTWLRFGEAHELVFCVESEFLMHDAGERLRGFFLLMPDVASLHAMLRAIRLA